MSLFNFSGCCNSPKASVASMKNINPLFVHSSVGWRS
jgi:hypothetical protein